uniref:Putative reverse transcriptase, intron maturase and HNH endonuclease n=1 Tax=Jenufa perforata TaxID=993091 RepID=A0A0S2LNG8_9CHLO|nr:putative reverse transcriptase, intron maturase and HNH endonuclease [Jenufa perforata]ALO62923.1 putative reverse transcriptase, intron maturase and HNH endonuclease [Jenufa perforata]
MSKLFNLAWQDVRWASVHRRVLRVQQRIYKASFDGNTEKIHFLQKKLINSLDAKLLAVQRVTTLNKGRKIPGADKIKVTSDKEKIKLVNSVKIDGLAKVIYQAKVSKSGKIASLAEAIHQEKISLWRMPSAEAKSRKNLKLRKTSKLEKKKKNLLGIRKIKDRIKQTLALLALEPQWEALFEPNSYGFRPARRAQDAIEAIYLNMHHRKPKWVYTINMKKCFENLDHKVFLEKTETFSVMHKQIKAWLKANIMKEYANTSNEITTSTNNVPQGNVISFLFANIAFHGLENHLKEYVSNIPGLPYQGAARGKKPKRAALGIVRYGDDLVLIHINKTILEASIEETSKWLKKMGLEMSAENSILKLGTEGFTFLGFQIIQVNKNGKIKIKIHPSKISKMEFLLKIRKIIQFNKAASSFKLIKSLRPIIIGWGNYFKFSESKEDFNKLSYMIFEKLRAWVFRRGQGRYKLKERYFPSGKTYIFQGRSYQDNWILNGKTKTTHGLEENFLPQMFWIASEKYVKVKTDKSPYDGDHTYWVQRNAKYSSFSTCFNKLLKVQQGICPICKSRFTSFDHTLEVDHILPKSKGGKDEYSNLQLLHKYCHVRKTANDLKSILQEPDEGKLSSPDRKTRQSINGVP